LRLLLDTCSFLWFAERPENLSSVARTALQRQETTLYLSSASLWEILVKFMAGKHMSLHVPQTPERYFVELRQRFDVAPLPISEDTVTQLTKLPPIHQDPFDRLLICQAIEHGLTLVTPDEHIRRYPIKTLW
jgi:PIN domain nuclease of toxin-antitoxin system